MGQIRPCDWHILSDDVACASIQKNASTSLTVTFPRVGVEHILEKPVRVAWVRNPISRLRSAYQYFQGAGRGYLPAEVVATWPRFVDHILTHEDVHWASQKEVLTFCGLFIPTHVERFENLLDRWFEYSPKMLPCINPTDRWIAAADYRDEDLDNYFAEDMELWHGIA